MANFRGIRYPATPRRPGGELTERQAEILAAIDRHMTEHQRPPTIRHLGQLLGIGSPNGVVSMLRLIHKKGFLEQHEFTACCWVICKRSDGPYHLLAG